MGRRFTYIPNRVIDTNGISDGASIYVYQTGTTTLVSLYSDESLTTPIANPYVVPAGAAVPEIYHDHSGNIRVRVVQSGGEVVSDDDPYQAPVTDIDLASTDAGKGAALVGLEEGGTAQQAVSVSLASMQAIAAPSAGQVAYLSDEGREGRFVYRAGDHTSEIAADTEGGVYVAASDDPTGASGAWVREAFGREVHSKWFGAKHDGATDDSGALLAWAAVSSLVPNLVAVLDDGTAMYSTANGPIQFTASLTRVTGDGRIKATDAASNLVEVTGSYCRVDSISLEGDGTYNDSAVSELSRWTLLHVSGDYCRITGAKFYEAHQIFVRFYLTIGGGVVGCEFHGGIDVMVGTAYQGIRGYSANGFIVEGNEFFPNATGGRVEEAIIPALFSAASENILIKGNVVHAAWDHGVYSIGPSNITITGNNITSTGSAIAVSSPDSTVDRTKTLIIADNVCIADDNVAANSGTVGLFMRDANFQTCANNTIIGFPTGIQLSPVQYGTATNILCDNSITGNKIIGVTQYGIATGLGSLTALQIARNVVANNHIVFDTANVQPVSRGLSFVSGDNGSGNDVLQDNLIEGNIVEGGETGLAIQDNTGLRVIGNSFLDQSVTGILALRATDCEFRGNKIKGAPTYGIQGSNNCVGCVVADNLILGASTLAIRQFQQAGHTNTFSGNKTGSSALSGLVTLSAAASTVVSNDNINVGLGYTSYVELRPINAAAAALVGGASSPYVAAVDMVAKTSFTIKTAGGAAAAGTEQFHYRVIQ